MFKRAVRGAVARGVVTPTALGTLTDDAFMQLLIERDGSALAAAIRERRLYKRAFDLPASEVAGAAPWVSDDPALLEAVEDRLAVEVGLAPGELLLDFPSRPDMLSVRLPLRLRDGSVVRLTDEGRSGHLGLPRIAEELYRSARRLRLFVRRPTDRPVDRVRDLVGLTAEEIRGRLDSGALLR